MEVDDRELAAFLQLRNGDVHKALARDLEKLQGTLVRTNDAVTVRQIQGAARNLQDILSLIDGTSRQHKSR